MRDCLSVGHIRVDDDPRCLACDELLTTDDVVTVNVTRPQGELTNPQDVATIPEWGPCG